ncbi:type II toxin-antitoxin system YafQ family toxin [Olsenella sp. YH-ols2217]|uniref:Type II toxin-antitoxin system YafQ family toxin n=1 Tax=Kribbibacterium absianum TaxID=3044210 RepID=A0ABT6ZJQ2_9ACTN|nr:MULTISPECIES: type II toxin-antitoxin system YafQ family toxin [unclassified Olsenella]MDJ1122462.1 type II toxin-antitoxin system YafQ family toxin [Olsenella sp. YH-ols2216]MDJ1129284.1 type II toxin-antitoxin system YafQ family toxin [Olsenella sp. YH-ols2217]
MPALILQPSGAFRRDLKRAAAKGVDIEAVQDVVELVRRNDPDSLAELRRRHRCHLLEPKRAGIWECHVANTGDLLLTWRTDGKTAYLLHLGDHDHALGR